MFVMAFGPIKDFFIKMKTLEERLIEFNKIHNNKYEYINAFGGSDKYLKLVKHDKLKNEFAEERGFKLLRIPFWEINNISNILSEVL
jgi:hypothetical protein